ncbi:MAG: DUF1585 domain-containing protein [Planctomycetia bacterium]|nr:DUF1585 domain-containing protein [Planctomycetia bacterium]
MSTVATRCVRRATPGWIRWGWPWSDTTPSGNGGPTRPANRSTIIRRDFHRCLAEKLLTYALGRGLEYFDGPAVDSILEKVEQDGRLDAFVQGVVASVPFQSSRGPATAPPAKPAPKPATKGKP